jgi:hypothetical protein
MYILADSRVAAVLALRADLFLAWPKAKPCS